MARGEAVSRLIAFAWLATGGWVITAISATIGIPLGVIDFILTAVLGSGISEDGRVFGWVIDSLNWNAEQSIYVLSGQGQFQALP